VERRRRAIHYSIAMAIRLVCVILCLFVTGWWLVVPVLGAVVLPYVAVVLVNVTSNRNGIVVAPGLRELGSATAPASGAESAR